MLANNNNVWFVLLFNKPSPCNRNVEQNREHGLLTDAFKYMITILYSMMFFRITLPAASSQKRPNKR